MYSGTTPIEIVDSAKCLGLHIDKSLTWSTHIDKISHKFSGKLKKLYPLRSCSRKILATIYFQGILPSVLYGIQIWGNCAPNLLNNVEKIHCRAARFICGVKRNVPDHHVLSVCNWKSISHYYKISIACKTFKILNKMSTPRLNDLVRVNPFQRTRNYQGLIIPSFKYMFFKHSFQYRASKIWNNIPKDIKEKPSVKSFKTALRKSNVLEKINFNAVGLALNYESFIYY